MTKILKIFVWVVLILLLTMWDLYVSAEDSPMLRELIEPNSIALDHRNIYIPDGTGIYIYDRKDFRLKKRIGKKGEGPQEFLLDVMRGAEELFIDVRTPVLVVNSLRKVSFFNKSDGSFIRELKSNSRTREFKPIGSGFAGQAMVVEEGIQYRCINIYDSRLNKEKEVFRVKHHFQMREGLRVLPAAMRFATHDNKLYIAWEEDLVIRVFDGQGNPRHIIRKEYERVKVTDQFKKQTITYFKTHKMYKQLFETLNPKLLFPSALPAIADMKIDDGKIYVTTYRTVGGGTGQCLVFDVRGKFMRELTIPLERRDEMLPYPYTISSGRLYQLVEDGEDWRLRITELEAGGIE